MKAFYALTLLVVCLPGCLPAQTVQSLTLINADTSQPIPGYDPIQPNTTLNLATLPTRTLNIRANVASSTVGSVRFVFGAATRTESAAPYAMAGDTAGDYWPWTPTQGALMVTATPFSGTGATGTAGPAYSMTLQIVDVPPTTLFTTAVTNGTGSGMYPAGAAVTIAANSPQIGRSFDRWTGDFSLANPTQSVSSFTMPARNVNLTATYRDTSTTYAVTVNNGTGTGRFTAGSAVSITANAAPMGKVFDRWTGDAHVLSSVTAPSTGFAMPAAPVTLTATYKDAPVQAPIAVTSLLLINLNTNAAIPGYNPIPNGATINLAILPSRLLTIRAVVNDAAAAKSVRFVFPGGTHVDNWDKFYMSEGPWVVSPGSYTVTATPYTLTNAAGTPGTPGSVSFTVIDTAAGGVTPPSPPSVMPEELNGTVTVEAEHFISQDLTTNRQWYITSQTHTPKISPDGDPNHAAGASGGAYVEALPDTRRSNADTLIPEVNTSFYGGRMAVLRYEIKFNTPGRYYIWTRMYPTGREDNSIHGGINGTWPDRAADIVSCARETWVWESAQKTSTSHCGVPGRLPYLDVPTAGVHTIMFSMREDGFEFDKFLLTTNPNMPRPPN